MKRISIITIFFFILITQSCVPLKEVAKEYPCDNVHTTRIGAMCNDGTRSNSTGAGACSSHGGVRNWLCN